MKRAKLEVCCGSIDDVIAIKDLDCDRIELNCALELGGLTPSLSTLKMAKQYTDKPIMCMVRCRGNNFIYSKEELEVMYADARLLIENGADGLVFGALSEDETIDIEALKMMRLIAKDKTLVFHKAFDVIKDKEKALKILIAEGVDRILLMNETGEDILQAAKRIGMYHDTYGDKIEFLPGGGITEENILKILSLTKADQIHGTFKKIDTTGIKVAKERVKKTLTILKGDC